MFDCLQFVYLFPPNFSYVDLHTNLLVLLLSSLCTFEREKHCKIKLVSLL
jgi:hypothetical protein